MVIIWPLVAKLSHPLYLQQRPRWTGGLPIPKTLVNRPWNVQSSRVGTPDAAPPYPTVVHELLPLPAYNWSIAGVTKDSTGVILGSCTVKLFLSGTDILQATTTSDATTGAYVFANVSQQLTHYVVAYKAGSPDTAGTTVNTIRGS